MRDPPGLPAVRWPGVSLRQWRGFSNRLMRVMVCDSSLPSRPPIQHGMGALPSDASPPGLRGGTAPWPVARGSALSRFTPRASVSENFESRRWQCSLPTDRPHRAGTTGDETRAEPQRRLLRVHPCPVSLPSQRRPRPASSTGRGVRLKHCVPLVLSRFEQWPEEVPMNTLPATALAVMACPPIRPSIRSSQPASVRIGFPNLTWRGR